MVKQLLRKYLSSKPQARRAMIMVFTHPDLGRCVLHHPDEAHMLLAKGDVTITAARFYLKPYFKFITSIDLHH
jgi:serine acetyltransferase